MSHYRFILDYRVYTSYGDELNCKMTLMQLNGDKDYVTRSGRIIEANVNLLRPIEDYNTFFKPFFLGLK